MNLGSLTSWPRARYWLASAIVGALAFILALAVRGGSALASLAIVFTIAYLVIAALSGAAARRRGERPGWAAALPGLIYGALDSLSAFTEHVTAASMRRTLGAQGVHVTAATVAQANSFASHVASWVIGVLMTTLLGIVVGSVAGALIRDIAEHRRSKETTA